MVIEFWSLAPLLLASVPQTLFVLFYGLRWFGAGQWWRDSVGRALFVKAAGLAIVLDLLTAHVFSLGVAGVSFAAPVGGFATAETVGYWIVFAGVCYQLGVLLAQRLGHERHTPL